MLPEKFNTLQFKDSKSSAMHTVKECDANEAK